MIKPQNVIWRWTPGKISFDENDPHRHDDVAEEYAIEQCEDASAGLVVWAKYHGEWMANPWSERPIIAVLLAELDFPIQVPKRRDRGER